MTKVITVRDFAQLTRDLPPLIEAAAIKGLRSAGARGVGEIVKQIDNADPFPAVDTGAMRQSTMVEPIPEGAVLSVNTPQAAWMEFGTRPHMPAFLPLLRWVTRKFGLSERKARGSRKARGGTPGKVRLGKMGPRERSKAGPKMSKPFAGAHRARKRSEARTDKSQMAFAIARKIQWKIYHRGTAPRGFFKKAMVTIHTKFAPQEVRRELKALEKRL